ncbi:MAG: hypothetical protein H0X58_04965 [Acidimicrobiia bacterium]|nr:hypothetical protein [Acidimicrobiia bacterium]
MADASLERSLEVLERDADAVVKSLTAALRQAKKAKATAASGLLRDVRQALDASVRLAEQATSVTREVRDGWTFDEQDHFASGAFAKEVLALAAEEGLQAFEADERILSYPAIVTVSTSDTTVTIDKKKERRVRPSVLVATLKALQARPPKFKAEAFLESLAVAYDLALAGKGAHPGATAKLAEIYRILTVLPGSGRDYTKQEFARDLYLLDQSGKVRTNSGRTMHLPASALTRGSGTFVTVARSGQEKVYAGISFVGAAG